jgi:hypothetical protein
MNTVTVTELPFAHYFFDVVGTPAKNPYTSMKTLIESYDLGFASFMCRLSKVHAIIGGSSVTRVYMNDKVDYTPDDIDIFVKSNSDLRPVVAYMESYGYSIDMDSSMTKLMKSKGRPNNVDEDDADMEDILATYRVLQEKISEVWTYKKDDKKIQIVLLTKDAPIDFVRKRTDLSCSSIAYITWSSFYPHMKPFAIRKEVLYHLKRREMYIQHSYIDVLDGYAGEKRRAKLMDRIEKYKARGFTLIDSHSRIRVKADPRPHMKITNRYMAHDIIAADDISVSDAMKDSRNIVIYTAPNVAYMIDRYEMVKFCMERGSTYWNHKLKEHQMGMFLIQDYSVFTITKHKSGDKGYNLTGYPMKDFYNKNNTHKMI